MTSRAGWRPATARDSTDASRGRRRGGGGRGDRGECVPYAENISRAARAPALPAQFGSGGGIGRGRRAGGAPVRRPLRIKMWRIGIDVGGTFTDLAAVDDTG